MGGSYLSDAWTLIQLWWTVPVMGLAVAGLALLAGRHFVRRRKSPAAPVASTPSEKSAPARPGADPFFAGGSSERRAALRRNGRTVEVDLTDPKGDLPALVGCDADRSVGGLGLLTPKPLPVGSVWNAQPRNAAKTAPLVGVEIRSCTPFEGEWKLGCKFTKTPNYAVLLMFG
jgi:hypothetical protein